MLCWMKTLETGSCLCHIQLRQYDTRRRATLCIDKLTPKWLGLRCKANKKYLLAILNDIHRIYRKLIDRNFSFTLMFDAADVSENIDLSIGYCRENVMFQHFFRYFEITYCFMTFQRKSPGRTSLNDITLLKLHCTLQVIISFRFYFPLADIIQIYVQNR